MEKSQDALVRGRQLCTQLSIFEGRLAELLRFWCCQLRKLRKSRRITSFLTLSSSNIEEVSQKCFVFDVANFEKWGSLAELLRFWCCQVQKLRKSRRIVSFLMLSMSKIKDISQNCFVFPHIFVWGSCFWFCIPPPSPPSSSSSRRLPSSHIQLVITQLTHNSTHTQLAHMQLNSHNLSSHNLLTHNLPYSYITHTHTHTHTRVITQLVNTQLVHTQLPHTKLVHAQLAHTQLVLPDIHLRDRRGTWRHPPSFHVAGVALGHIHIHFTWHAWHLRHWAGSGGAPGSQLTPWTPRLFAWQAWRLVTSTFTLRGRRGTRWHAWHLATSFHVAGVALGHIHIRFTWQAWHLRHWAGSGGAPGSQLTPWTPRLFAWQAWHLVTSTFVSRGRRGTYGSGRALVAHRVPSWRRGRRGSLRGRRGTWWHPPSLCVAGVALGDRRGTWRHPRSFHVAGVALTALGGLWWRTGFSADAVDAAALCVAGVALGDIHLHFAWQAWH